MDTRVAVISIIIENPEMVERINALLHEYSAYIKSFVSHSCLLIALLAFAFNKYCSR